MGWVNFPLPETGPVENFTEPLIYQELVAAINEKDIAVHDDSYGKYGYNNKLADPSEHWFSATNIARVQAKIESLATDQFRPPGYKGGEYASFINHTDSGGNWEGEIGWSEFAPRWEWGGGGDNDITKAEYANVGNGNEDWTRRTGTDGSGVAYGHAETGDMGTHYNDSGTVKVAPYLNEMYRVLNQLRWTKQGSTIWINYHTGEPDAPKIYASYQTDWFYSDRGFHIDDCWDDMVANWEPVWKSEPTVVVNIIDPARWAYMERADTSGAHINPRWRATAQAVRNKYMLFLNKHFAHDVDWYFAGNDFFGPFFPTEVIYNSEGYFEDLDEIFIKETRTNSKNSVELTNWIVNDNSLPPRPPNPPGNDYPGPPGTPGSSYLKGWEVTVFLGPYSLVEGVVKWDIDGGFRKID